MLSQILVLLDIGLPVIALGVVVVGLAMTFRRESRVTEAGMAGFEAVRSDLQEIVSAANALLDRTEGAEKAAAEPTRTTGVPA